ncbi:MAG: integral rane protein MviN [Frankiales bacterium]|nr:integral rane protein MviN [Frankiales bacterium]
MTSLLGSARGMAVGTVASRATGFVRTAAIAAAVGVGSVGGLYNLANTTPNIVYELLLGGILTSTVVPLLVRAAKDDAVEGDLFAQRLLTLVLVVLGAATVVLVVAAPLVVDLYTNGLSPDDHRLAVVLTRFFLPQMLFYAAGAVLGAVLNTRGRFAVPMWAPVLNNLVVIASCALFLTLPGVTPLRSGTITRAQVLVLGIGVTLGIVAQTVALVPSLRAVGFSFRLRTDVRALDLRALGRLARWTLLYVVANQVALLVVVNLAQDDRALNEAGRGYAAYVNAFVLWQLPHAVVAVSVITALLPAMSRAAAAGDTGQVRAQLDRGLRLTVAVLVPASVSYVVLGRQVATVVFAHGQTTSGQARFLGVLLGVFALGMVPFSAYQLQLRAFYAASDTRTPTLVNLAVNAVVVVVDVVLYLALPRDLKVVGLAAGHAASFGVGLVVCGRVVRRRLGPSDPVVLRTAVRCLVATLPAAVVAYVLVAVVERLLGRGWGADLLALALAGPVLLVGYAATAARLRVPEVGEAVAPVLRRLGVARSSSR